MNAARNRRGGGYISSVAACARSGAAPAGQTDFSIIRSFGIPCYVPHGVRSIADKLNTTNGMMLNSLGVRRKIISPKIGRTWSRGIRDLCVQGRNGTLRQARWCRPHHRRGFVHALRTFSDANRVSSDHGLGSHVIEGESRMDTELEVTACRPVRNKLNPAFEAAWDPELRRPWHRQSLKIGENVSIESMQAFAAFEVARALSFWQQFAEIPNPSGRLQAEPIPEPSQKPRRSRHLRRRPRDLSTDVRKAKRPNLV